MARRQDLQRSLYEEQPPARAGNPLFCHQEFLEKMGENRANTVGRRAALLLHRLLVDVRLQPYKTTRGDNRGWRRSPLGGNHGSHFYAWWAPQGAAPLRSIPEFEDAPAGAVFLRDIRHHDDHRTLKPQSLAESYLPIGVKELRQEDYVPAPWTTAQARFAQARQKIRIIKGHPGSGKTTALWHAADLAGRESILYITYSPELAALARDHFDKFEPRDKRFQVVTYARLLRELLSSALPYEPARVSRGAFVKEISSFSATILGPWLNEKGALYDELHAHLFGALLPVPLGRFPGFPDRRITARQYRDLRERALGRPAAEAAFEVAETLRRRSSEPLEPRFFRELDLAWQAVAKIRSQGAGSWANFDCIAIDEVQDLTPIEALAIVELAVAMGGGASVLAAGDEAQTVRPTDFEWGWFQDLLHFRLASPVDFKLQANLRSPRRIADLVNRAWDLYGAIEKRERPSGAGEAEIDVNAGDQVLLCAAKPGQELEDLLRAFSEREGLALIALGDEVPAYVPEALRPSVLTTFEAKGLDFQSVCVLEAGKWLDRIVTVRELGRGLELESLSKRLAIDQLRVALSRPSERLYWLDVSASERTLERARRMLSWEDLACAMSPAALLKTLEEESLDPEDRVLLCEADARQLLGVRPALAWSRAKQAVALLGEPGGAFSVADPAARKSARMTLCQTAFTLAFHKVGLPAEMGRLDLFEEAAHAALDAGQVGLPTVIRAIAAHQRDSGADGSVSLVNMALQLADYEEIDPWLVEELQTRSGSSLLELESQVDKIPILIHGCLPKLYRIFAPMEAAMRTARLRDKTIHALMKMGEHASALQILLEAPGTDPKLIAECREGLKEFEAAAQDYLRAGSPKDALRCYRSLPDFDKALELLEGMPDHPARASMVWLRRMRDLAAERPPEFSKAILPGEKKVLEQILEASLGATRKKAVAKAAPKAKRAPAAKRPVKPRKKPKDNPYF